MKTAAALLSSYPCVDSLYAAVEGPDASAASVKPAAAKKLLVDKPNALLSLQLARICTEVPGLADAVDSITSNRQAGSVDRDSVLEILRTLEMRSLVEKADSWLPMFCRD